MADGRLSVDGLGQRAPKRRVEKDRVVAESAAAVGLWRDLPFDDASRLEDRAATVDQRQRADEPGCARRLAALGERLIDQRKLLRVAALDAAEPSRVDAGRAAERVDRQTRIFGDGQ